jgi:hypothetical protein
MSHEPIMHTNDWTGQYQANKKEGRYTLTNINQIEVREYVTV